MHDQLSAEVAALAEYEQSLEQVEQTARETEQAARDQARRLGRARQRAARKLAREVTGELEDLEFGAPEFGVHVEALPESLSATGADRVEFLVALNPGEGKHPLKAVASGGELSRLLLAVKRALAGVGPVSTYIFDEVDTGIGGAVASAVGRKLREVSDHHQVICITHLAQIAGMSNAHFCVSKTQADGRTATRIDHLTRKARVEELARMLGGEKVSGKTRAAARELMVGS